MGHNQKEKKYSLTYHRLVPAEITALDPFWQTNVLAAIEEKLLLRPEIFGKPLRRSLKGCRSLRVGDYRVIFQIHQKAVLIIAIMHRSSEYKGIEKRI